MKPSTRCPALIALWCVTALSPACGDATAYDRAPAPSPTPTAATTTADGPVAALAYVADGSPTGRAITAAQATLRAKPDAVSAHVTLAMLLMRRQRETSDAVLMRYAEDVLTSARAVAPDDPQVKLMTAMTLQDGHRFSQVAALTREVLAADPDDTTAHLLLGDALLELGDYEGAMDAVQAAMDRHPDLRSYNRAAHLRWLVGDFDSALAIMELALDSGSRRDPEAIAWCYADLGTMFLHRGDGARALASAERALALVPDYVPALGVQARALARTGALQAAISTLDRVVERRASAEDLLLLARWHEERGNSPAAVARRADADRLADEDPRPVALDLARRGVHSERALELAQAAREARADIATHDALAMALARTDQHERALVSMERALALGTADPNLHLHAALVHALAGRLQPAKAARQRADAIDPHADPLVRAELDRRLGAA